MIENKESSRRRDILNAALCLAEECGTSGLVRIRVAEKVGISSSLVHNYFRDMNELRKEVIEEALKDKRIDVLVSSLSIRDLKKLNAEVDIINKVCDYLKS